MSVRPDTTAPDRTGLTEDEFYDRWVRTSDIAPGSMDLDGGLHVTVTNYYRGSVPLLVNVQNRLVVAADVTGAADYRTLADVEITRADCLRLARAFLDIYAERRHWPTPPAV